MATCYVLAAEMRDLRPLLRYRNLVVHQSVRMQNRMAGLLMESGTSFIAIEAASPVSQVIRPRESNRIRRDMYKDLSRFNWISE